MLVKIVPIGTSKGIRIPASYLKALGATALDMVFDEKEKTLTLRASRSPREGWTESLAKETGVPEKPLRKRLKLTSTMREDFGCEKKK